MEIFKYLPLNQQTALADMDFDYIFFSSDTAPVSNFRKDWEHFFLGK